MEFKSLRRRDFGKIQQFAITGMHLFNYTSNRIELFFYAKYFWYLELLRATRIYAAYDGDEFAGVLLLDIAGEEKAYKSTWHRCLLRSWNGSCSGATLTCLTSTAMLIQRCLLNIKKTMLWTVS